MEKDLKSRLSQAPQELPIEIMPKKAKRVFKKATQIWSSVTCLDFTESSTATDRIQLILASGCWSHLGRIGGVQYMSLGQGCEWVGTAEHELGHALGFHHTQIRHDRDDFVTIYPDNFQNGWLSQFIKQTEKTNYNYNLTYDYGSIMHYGGSGLMKIYFGAESL
ncbi:Astacin (Peptidase M12A) [Parelaphostrongylus tenuis]|uniref:Metalloendopeptidase n=1 Tax=Parelaphostrongylus tenuis TaxID=148309 RepID=A0AAD5WHW6_PARTN|nr:Astacin (Peptidase M12A) [Parelaphostrongylus tenuis]